MTKQSSSPSELKRCKGGERQPNARALGQAAPLILWGRRSPDSLWLKLTNDTSKAEMARRTKQGWEVQRVPVGQSPSK